MEINNLVTRWEDVSGRKTELEQRRTRQSQSYHVEDSGGRAPSMIEDEQRTRAELKDEWNRKKENAQLEEGRLTKAMYSMKANLSEIEKTLTEASLREEKNSELEQVTYYQMIRIFSIVNGK